MNRTLAAVGELRVELLEMLHEAGEVDLMCAAPGWLPRSFAGQREIAVSPEARLTRHTAHAWRSVLLDFLGSQVDVLPQTERWESLLRAWGVRLRDRRARVFHHTRYADASRVICAADRSILFSGPVGRDERGLRFELTGDAHTRARAWLAAEIEGSEDISSDVAEVIEGSWAYGSLDPEDLYYKVLYEYFGSTLSGLDRQVDDNPLLDALTDFQRAAYYYCKGVLRQYGGVFLSDVVGLGKTWIAMALLKHLQDRYDHHAVVIAPPAVCPAWQELAHEYRVEVVTLSIGKLDELPRYEDREVLLIDESHHFRNVATLRYDTLDRWLRPDGQPSARQVLLLSATPQNNDPQDILNQLKLMPDNYNRLPYRGESLDDWLREVRAGREDPRSLLQHVVVRRTRSFIRASYPDAKLRRRLDDGSFVWEPLHFPTRLSGPDQCLRYSLDARDTQGSVYDLILAELGTMSYPLFGLGQFVLPSHLHQPQLIGLKRTGTSLRGLYKSLLLKRLESSLHAFSMSIGRLRARTVGAVQELAEGWVRLAGTEAERADEELEDGEDGRLPAAWFDVEALQGALTADREVLARLTKLVHDLRSQPDPKLARIEAWFADRPPSAHRTLVFTQFGETADWLADQLGQRFGRTAVVTGARGGKLSIARRFAPRANRVTVEDEIDLLVSTDVLSEGVNLQDADTLINFDLHWNPVRLIQRAGRIDRIGSEHDEIVVASFLPERRLEAGLGIEQVLRKRIAEFLKIFGEDSAVLPSEDLPEEARMLAAYTGVALEEADRTDDMDGLSRHVNRILALREGDKDRFERIVALRNGRRAWSAHDSDGVVACRVGWFWKFWGVGRTGDLTEVDDLAGLDLWYAHARRGAAIPSAAGRAGVVAEDARALFAPKARQFVQQRERPQLSVGEQFVLDRLQEYRAGALTTQRPLIDAIEQWVRAGAAKAILQRESRAWKKNKLSPHALFHEVRLWWRRYPGQEEDIGDPELVGLVLPGS